MYRTARITFQSWSRANEETTTATVRHDESMTAEATTREVRSALFCLLRGESARIIRWELVPLVG
jgi:hypothetical protein